MKYRDRYQDHGYNPLQRVRKLKLRFGSEL